jgi:hypothetical protein
MAGASASPGVTATPAPTDTVPVLEAEQATKAPRLIDLSPTGSYLTQTGTREMGGSACVRFVLLENGKADPATIEILQLSNVGFRTAAVRTIRGATYSPAELNGRPVRVRVKQGLRWAADGSSVIEVGRLTSACS